MGTKTKSTKGPENQAVIDCYPTSVRISRVCSRAMRYNKHLARQIAIRELGFGYGTRSHDQAERGHESREIVLSHVEDEHPGPESLKKVPNAFHLLLTGPDTHPSQILEWTREAGIRSQERLHAVSINDQEALEVSQLLGRYCAAMALGGPRDSIIDAFLAGQTLVVLGPMHRTLRVPISLLPSLKGQGEAVLRNFEVDPDGSFLYWPDLDVHLGWDQFLQAVDPKELLKARQRTEGFNQRYGAAIRSLRETSKIPQSGVEGLTERHIRRIEQGELGVTPAAILALAKAHGMDADSYMERVAKEASTIVRIPLQLPPSKSPGKRRARRR